MSVKAREQCSVLLLLSLFCLPPSFAGEKFHKGLESYKQKDYKNAVLLLAKAEAEDPYNAEIHYYLANSYVFLQDGKSAVREYSLCFDLEPLSNYGQYSRQALLAFGKKFKGFTDDSAQASKHLAPDDPKSIRQAVALIRGQTGERGKLNHDWGERAAKAAVSGGEIQGQKMNKQAESLLDDLSAMAHASPALQEELHEIQQRAVFEAQRAQQDAQQQAAKHMSAAARRSTLVESSASSLLALISENPRPGHIKVKAAGTNLYVRNYGVEPLPPQEALLASWESLTPPAQANAPAAGDRKSGAKSPGNKKQVSKPAIDNRSLNSAPQVVRERPSSLASPGANSRWGSVFIPGESKVVVTDVSGRILLHVRDDGSK